VWSNSRASQPVGSELERCVAAANQSEFAAARQAIAANYSTSLAGPSEIAHAARPEANEVDAIIGQANICAGRLAAVPERMSAI